MPISIWTITSVRERTMLTCLSVYQIPCGLGDHHRRSVGLLWAFCGFSVSNICASIIMMQKVAANVDNVAADLCFRASEVRWLLMKIFFAIAASSAADFLCTSINIVMPYLRHCSSFVPKIFPKVSNREQGYSFTFV